MMSETISVNAWNASAIFTVLVSQTAPGCACHRETNQSLRIEHPSAEPLGDGHSQVDIESHARYPHAGVGLVLAGEEGVRAMMVMMAEDAVAMAVVVVVLVMVVSVTRVVPSLL